MTYLLQSLDRAIEEAAEVSHAAQGRVAHDHIELAIALLKEAWMDLDGQKARSVEELTKSHLELRARLKERGGVR